MPPYGEFIFGHEYAGDVAAVGGSVTQTDGSHITGDVLVVVG